MPGCSTQKPSVLAALCLALLVPGGAAWADLLSPEVQSAWKRYEQNPKAFDQADQYCVAKKPGAACVIPGSAFEGGGAGICERAVSQGSQYISLNCNRGERIQNAGYRTGPSASIRVCARTPNATRPSTPSGVPA